MVFPAAGNIKDPDKRAILSWLGGGAVVEKVGVNVETLLDLLLRNPSVELTTFYYYTILRVNLIGLEGEGLKQIAEDARIEDRNHFEALVPRIYELGGKIKPQIFWHFRVPVNGALACAVASAMKRRSNWLVFIHGHHAARTYFFHIEARCDAAKSDRGDQRPD